MRFSFKILTVDTLKKIKSFAFECGYKAALQDHNIKKKTPHGENTIRN